MPTLDEWQAALRSPRLVSIESSLDLIAEIQARQSQLDAQLAARGKSVAQRKLQLIPAANLPDEFSIEPMLLLHRLGVVTTPAIENLADICAGWASTRYLWAFELPSGSNSDRLRLSQHALSIDFHQKGLMSDYIGIGMAAVLMSTFFGAPHASDVSIAMSNPNWPIALTSIASPDYIFSNDDQSNLYVVECKGTRCSKRDAIDQIIRGLEQVPSLNFTDGRPRPPALVIGTRMTSSSVRVYVVDPPGEDSSPPKLPIKTGTREWRIPESKVVIDAARHVSQAKVLSYAGLGEAAAAKLERSFSRHRELPRVTPSETIVDENEFGAFRGVRQPLPSRDNLWIEIFQAVYEPLREAYIEDDVDRISEELQRLTTRIPTEHARAGGHGIASEQRGANRFVRSLAPDGTLLELRFTPQ